MVYAYISQIHSHYSVSYFRKIFWHYSFVIIIKRECYKEFFRKEIPFFSECNYPFLRKSSLKGLLMKVSLVKEEEIVSKVAKKAL